MHLINKRDFSNGATCLRLMVLARKQKELFPDLDAAAHYSFAVGNQIGALARQLFPGGVLVEFGDDRVEETLRLVAAKTPIIFEAAFESQTAQAILDVMVRQPDGSYHIYEAKSATSAKSSYFNELAIQGVVAAANGVRVTGYNIIHINRDVVYDGIEFTTDILATVDVTKEILPLLENTELFLGMFHERMNETDAPAADLKFACKGCDLQVHCHGELPNDHNLFLPGMSTKEFATVQSGTPVVFADPPKKVRDSQRLNFRNALSQGGFVAEQAREELRNAPYPHVFLDFEVFQARLPIFANTKPYDRLQFQYSAHIREHPEAELEHVEYLPTHNQDPRPEFSANLYEIIRNAGTIFTYSHYENTQLSDLLRNEFEYSDLNAEKLKSCELDLLKIVRTYTYHPEYRGSFSIKTVLPSWVPELSYKDLAIQDGMVASVKYKELVDSHGTANAEQLRAEMLAYCKLDTLAMVRVYDALLNWQPTS